MCAVLQDISWTKQILGMLFLEWWQQCMLLGIQALQHGAQENCNTMMTQSENGTSTSVCKF